MPPGNFRLLFLWLFISQCYGGLYGAVFGMKLALYICQAHQSNKGGTNVYANRKRMLDGESRQ